MLRWLPQIRVGLLLMAALVLYAMTGCGTTRLTGTQRTATEQMLISNAIDLSVSQINFTALAGRRVYFDPQYLEGTVDRGYLVSALRQHLLASGCLLQEDRSHAVYVVEARAGAVGTDRHSLLIGVPAMNVPAVVPGQPSQIPEIPFAKKTDQRGAAKLAVYAYNRTTGQPVLQSGTLQAMSSAKDLWVLGAGPFRNGSIRKKTEYGGLAIPTFGPEGETDESKQALTVTQAAVWPENLQAPPRREQQLMSRPPLFQRTISELIQTHFTEQQKDKPAGTLAPAPPESKLFDSPPLGQNSGGHAETEPVQTIGSGWSEAPDS